MEKQSKSTFKKKTVLILCIILCVVLLPIAYVAYVSLPWILLFIGNALSSNPPEPVITYGEFPFRLEYKIDGETSVVEDVVICEYVGVTNPGIGDKRRAWKNRLKSNQSLSIVIFENDDTEINVYVGDAAYYMDELLFSIKPQWNVIVDGLAVNQSRKQEVLEKYNVEIVNFEFSEPIKNSYKDSLGRITDG